MEHESLAPRLVASAQSRKGQLQEGHAWAPGFCRSTRQTPPTGRCSHVPSTLLVTLKSSAKGTSLRSAAESAPEKPGLAASGWINGSSLALVLLPLSCPSFPPQRLRRFCMVATWPSDHRQVWASLQGLLNLAQRNRQSQADRGLGLRDRLPLHGLRLIGLGLNGDRRNRRQLPP